MISPVEYLSPPVEQLLGELGVMSRLETHHPEHLRGFQIFAPNGDSFRADFSATKDERGRSYFDTGLTIPRLLLDTALVQKAQATGAELREGWRLAQLGATGKPDLDTGSRRQK